MTVRRLDRLLDPHRRGARGCPEDVLEVVAGHRRADELGADGRAERVGAGVRRQVAGPRRVDVAGQEDRVGDVLVGEVLEHLPTLDRVAVPLVGVVLHALRGQQPDGVLEAVAHAVRQRRDQHGGDHHRVAHELPLRGGRAEPALQPGDLVVAGDLAAGVVARRHLGECASRGGAVAAQVEHRELGEPAEREPAVDLRAVPEPGRAAQPHGHPLVVGAVGRGPTGRPGALRGGVVVLRALEPGVVGRLVVVPRADERDGAVQGLQVRVGLVERVPTAVVRERHDLVRRVGLAHDDVLLAHGVLAGAVLVDVVAEVQDDVDLLLREVAVGAEVAGLVVGAGHDAEAHPRGCGVRRRRGAGTAGR